jgi:hypothetical protein
MEIEICGYKVQIDEEDYERVTALAWHINTYTVSKCGKVYILHTYRINKKTYPVSLHRFILGLTYHDNKVCDHISGDTLDNRKCNLRVCTTAENVRNCKLGKGNTSGYKGVYFNKRAKRYLAQIKLNNKKIHLGYYDTPEEAHAAYCEASKKYHGEFGRTE